MNFIQLVGRVIEMPVPMKQKDNRLYSQMVLEVEQNFRNLVGEVRCDRFNIKLWRGASDEIVERCKKGRLLGIKGRVEVEDNNFVIIAEHVEHIRP